MAWGDNPDRALGDNTSIHRNVAVQVTGLANVIGIATGQRHSLAVRSDGTVWAWGNNSTGQLGIGTTTDSSVPIQVAGLTGVTAIAAGFTHSLALCNDGTVWAFGANTYGQLGNATTTADSSIPVQVAGLTSVTAVAAGYWHNLGLHADGTVSAWGINFGGELGNGTTTNSNIPVPVASLPAIAAGSHSLALSSGHIVWAWGQNGAWPARRRHDGPQPQPEPSLRKYRRQRHRRRRRAQPDDRDELTSQSTATKPRPSQHHHTGAGAAASKPSCSLESTSRCGFPCDIGRCAS